MGAVDTTYTFTATDTITSTKMNNIIDQTTITTDAIIGNTLEVASGKLKVRAQGITSNEMAAGSVTSNAIADGTIVNADISPTAAIAGTKISASFGNQNITATGDIGLEGTASDYTVVSLNNTSGVQVHLNANGNTEGNLRTTTNHPLTLSTNNTERMRISASGNVGIGTSSPSEKLTVIGPSGGASALFSDNVNSTLSIKHESPGNLLTYETGGTASQRWVLNGAERARIDYTGNIGIGKNNPSTILDVNGTVTATAFAGPLTGNVTGNVTGSSGSCTGNSATATNLSTNSTNWSTNGTINAVVGQLSWKNFGNNHTIFDASQSTSPSGTSVNSTNAQIAWSATYPTLMGWNGVNTYGVRVDSARASDTSAACTGNSATASTATTATTVSNGAITAAKLDGAQSGNAPIFGARAFVSFSGIGTIGSNMTIRSQGNVSSVNKLGTGRYRVTFATPMQDANYTTITGSDANSPHKIAGVLAQDASYVDIAYSQINTSTSRDDPDWGQVTIFR